MDFQNEQDMIDFGEELAKHLFPNAVITLEGDLGVVKQHLQKELEKV